jgi:cytosine/uracil/thiamine/allantoin permease
VLIDTNSKNKQVIMDNDTPEHIKRAAENAIQNLLPEKSSNRYWKEYEIFVKWRVDNSVSNYNEYVLLAYFEAKSKNLKSSTLWSIFSMLKSTLNVKHNINIETY